MTTQFQIAAITIAIALFGIGNGQTVHAQHQPTVAKGDSVEKLAKDREKAMIQAIYQQTRTAKTASDFTKLIDDCREGMTKKISDKNRKYLKSLEAWGFSRRGMSRCEVGKMMMQAGNLEQAKEVFGQANNDFDKSLELDPTAWRPTLGIGLIKAERGDYLGAIDDFSQLCDSHPKRSEGWFNRAELYYQLERFEKAKSDYEQVIELSPADLQAITGRGHCKLQLDEVNGALKDYQDVATLLPQNDSALINVGDAHQKLEQWKAAYESYFAAMTIKPSTAGAQKSAWLMATCPDPEICRPELALQLAEKAIELGGETRRNLDTLAAAQAANGDFTSAEATQKVAIAKSPKPTDAETQRLAMYASGEKFTQGQTAAASTAELANPLKPKTTIRE
jgi:tetratricopeptide (TPR) repeat protein